MTGQLGLHETFAVLTAGELTEIAEKAKAQADALRNGEATDSYSRGWALIFDYVGSAASYALTVRQLEISSV